METDHLLYLAKAFEAAFEGMNANKGGPFGAVVVLDGKVIGSGCNEVISTNDPVAHAEINAIQAACKTMGHFHLEEATLYCTCEPCPMCLAAIYWAKIGKVVYASRKEDAAAIGFSDLAIHKNMGLHSDPLSLQMIHIAHPLSVQLFREWMEKKDKTYY